MSSEELKPCPFCGGKAHATEEHRKTRTPERVMCLMCAAELNGPGAIAQWNTRAQLAAIQGGMNEPIEPCTDLNHHERYRAGWNACLAQHKRITAAMAAEVERWERSFRDIHEPALRDAHAYIQELRAELAEVKGREAVGEVQLRTGGGISLLHVDLTQPLPPGTKLYTTPPASPDVEGLCRLLAQAQGMVNGATDQWHDEVRDALSTWRQAQEVKSGP